MAVPALTMEASLDEEAGAGAAGVAAGASVVAAGASPSEGAVKPDTVAVRDEPEAVSAVFSAVANSAAKPSAVMA